MECLEYQAVTFAICPMGIGQPLEVFKSLGSQIVVVRLLIWQQIINILKEVYTFKNRLLPHLLIMVAF